jgi:UDP-glucose 4-epimerase
MKVENEIEETKPIKILIIGIAGGLAQITSRVLLGKNPDYQIFGVDNRKIPESNIKGLNYIKMKFSRGNFEKLFREHEFDIVYHLGRISHSTIGNHDLSKRLELSVMGTSRILDLSLRFNVKKIIVLSTFHVYGALSDNTIFLNENDPLRASMKHGELRDVVEMDQICTNWMWKYQEKMSTVVLRPCNIIGSQISNTMSKYLTSPFAIRPIDYNPVFQFIHELDMATVLARSAEELPTGIYNVATDDFISLGDAFDIVGTKGIPFPISIATPLNALLKKGNLDIPPYLIEYLKNSCLISNKNLKNHLGENFNRFSIKQALNLLKA